MVYKTYKTWPQGLNPLGCCVGIGCHSQQMRMQDSRDGVGPSYPAVQRSSNPVEVEVLLVHWKFGALLSHLSHLKNIHTILKFNASTSSMPEITGKSHETPLLCLAWSMRDLHAVVSDNKCGELQHPKIRKLQFLEIHFYSSQLEEIPSLCMWVLRRP